MAQDPLHGLSVAPSHSHLVLPALAVLLYAPDPWFLLCPQSGVSTPSLSGLQPLISSGLLRGPRTLNIPSPHCLKFPNHGLPAQPSRECLQGYSCALSVFLCNAVKHAVKSHCLGARLPGPKPRCVTSGRLGDFSVPYLPPCKRRLIEHGVSG